MYVAAGVVLATGLCFGCALIAPSNLQLLDSLSLSRALSFCSNTAQCSAFRYFLCLPKGADGVIVTCNQMILAAFCFHIFFTLAHILGLMDDGVSRIFVFSDSKVNI